MKLINPNSSFEKKQFIFALFIPILMSVFMILIFILEKGMSWDFHKAGILPRTLEGVSGIISMIFIHADLSHLLHNVFAFLLLSFCLYYFYREIASKVLIWLILLSGIFLWLIGRENWHIGASGLIYALAFFLFFSGLFRRHIPLIAISFVVIFLYGSIIWHIFPWEINDPVSWEGHLSGAVSGLVVAVIYRHSGPQAPKPEWEDEEDQNECEEQKIEENENNINQILNE